MTKIGFLIDLDGTLYRGHSVIPHAADWIVQLRRLHIPFLFVTNNSSRTAAQVAEHLNELGIQAQEDEVMSSAMATASYLKQTITGRKAFIIGEQGLKDAMIANGFVLTEDQPDVIVSGLDRSISYEKYTVAVRAILNGAIFVMTNPDQLLPSDQGFLPGSGAIASVIRTATGVQPTIIGKPSPILMNAALEKLSMSAREVWAVGDHILTDIEAGVAVGCPTLLVLTGVAQKGQLDTWYAQTNARPDVIMDDLSQLVSFFSTLAVNEDPSIAIRAMLDDCCVLAE